MEGAGVHNVLYTQCVFVQHKTPVIEGNLRFLSTTPVSEGNLRLLSPTPASEGNLRLLSPTTAIEGNLRLQSKTPASEGVVCVFHFHLWGTSFPLSYLCLLESGCVCITYIVCLIPCVCARI
jgi:hypothetical protein